MYALVDAVSYYASAEKVFDPSIRNKPVVVLTNNDGCICAVDPLARQLGVPKFKPYFQVKAFLQANGVIVRSSNYELYADLSERMMSVIAQFCDEHYVYSIDESFLYFKNYEHIIKNWQQYGHKIRRTVWRLCKLPVGVGFGPTITLAKAANHAAKKLPAYKGVAVINNHNIRCEILSQMSVTDVWGIGQRLGSRLNAMGIDNALQLSQQSPKTMRDKFSILIENTVNELNGIPCFKWAELKQDKKEICSTRSFGQRINTLDELKAAIVSHACIVARKARQQKSLIKKLFIFASNSVHDKHYYKKSLIYELPVATDNTLHLATGISSLIPALYLEGIQFYRCGVGALELESRYYQQQDLFNSLVNKSELMQCYDHINQRYGKGTIKVAAVGGSKHWHMRRHFLSPQYTSKWRDIPKIIC